MIAPVPRVQFEVAFVIPFDGRLFAYDKPYPL